MGKQNREPEGLTPTKTIQLVFDRDPWVHSTTLAWWQKNPRFGAQRAPGWSSISHAMLGRAGGRALTPSKFTDFPHWPPRNMTVTPDFGAHLRLICSCFWLMLQGYVPAVWWPNLFHMHWDVAGLNGPLVAVRFAPAISRPKLAGIGAGAAV